MTTNVPDGDGDYHTFEITGTKRMSNRWSLLASYGYTKSFDNGNTAYLGKPFASNCLPATPNDEINTDDGRHVYSRQTAKLAGTLERAVVGHRVSPMLRYQQGFPFGRTFASTLTERRQRPLPRRAVRHASAGPHRDHRRARGEEHRFGSRDFSVFFDLYNMFNSNPEQNLQWSSGTAFNRPLSIVPPRLARIGAKLNF